MIMEQKNELVVGLDIGTNSVGWAVVEINDQNGDTILQKIHGMGSRIIPMGQELKDFEQGNSITKNAVRRQKRSMRRNGQRYKLRRAKLFDVLHILNAWPEGLNELLPKGTKMLSPLEQYGLRAKAVDEQIALHELGRVLYHMNQRRGYKDIGDLMDELSGTATEEKADPKVVREIKQVVVSDIISEDTKGKRSILEVAVEVDGKRVIGTTSSTSFKNLIGEKLYIEIKTRTTAKGESIDFFRTSVTDWKKDKDKLDEEMENSGMHPGQFFYDEFQRDPLTRIRERIVLRERYKAEFNAIWKRQAVEGSVLCDPEIRDKVVKTIIPNNLRDQQQWLQRDLGQFVRDYVIYYQRPLKSQRSSIGNCRFETGSPASTTRKAIPAKQVMPVSSPIYQLFRIWQQVNNIRIYDRELKSIELTPEERIRAAHYLITHSELKTENLLKVIGRDNEVRENSLRSNLPGHQTLGPLRKHLSKTKIWDQLLGEAITIKNIRDSVLYRIWHILYSIPEEEFRKRALEAIPELDGSVIADLMKVRFAKKHGAVSARAAMRMIPLMQCGEDYDVTLIADRDKARLDKFITGEDIPGMDNEMRSALGDPKKIEDFQGLAYWEAATAVYGDHRATAEPLFKKPEDVKSLQRGFLRNPVVEQVVNETLMVVRDIWKTYGRPTSIRIELARELRQNQEQRAKTFSRNGARDKERKAVVEELITKHNRPKPSRKDIEKYELWVQQKHQCIYSGKTIEASQLFDTREVDIDHIIPQSKFYDDSIQNRVLCFRTENAGSNGKNKLLAATFMKSKGAGEWESYLNRVNGWGMSRGKRKYLLTEEVPESFINRQLQDTRYIGTEVRKHLERFAPTQTTLGLVTDLLKNEWDLNKVYKEVLIPRFERLEKIVDRKLIEEVPGRNGHKDWKIEGFSKRIDHRHHALDALVVSLTRQKFLQRLTNVNQLNLSDDQKEALKRPTWYPLPHPKLREMVKEQLERTIPSIKNRQRLLTKSSNTTKFLKDPISGALGEQDQRKGKVYAVRGALHDEQPMGEIREQHRWPLKKVIDWLDKQKDALAELKPLTKEHPEFAKRFIAHVHERALLHDHLTKYEGDIAKWKKGMKKDPIVNAKNEEVQEITVLETKYAMVRTLSQSFSLPMVEKIIDRKVRKRIGAHIKAFGDDPKKAFTGDGLNALNDGQGQKIFKVRCVAFDTTIENTKGFTPLLHKDDPNTKQHVKKGENFALVVYEHRETGERVFDVIPFYDAVQRKLFGLDIVDPKPGYRHFVLSKNDLVYVPRPDEDVRSIDWSDTIALGERVMRLTKMSGKEFYFLRCNISEVLLLGKQEMEFGSQGAAQFEDLDVPRTKISSVCVPISVSRIGNVIPTKY